MNAKFIIWCGTIICQSNLKFIRKLLRSQLLPFLIIYINFTLSGVSNLRPAGHIWPRMAMNAAQHKIVNYAWTFSLLPSFHYCLCIYVWPKTTPLLPVLPRDTKDLDTPVGLNQDQRNVTIFFLIESVFYSYVVLMLLGVSSI